MRCWGPGRCLGMLRSYLHGYTVPMTGSLKRLAYAFVGLLVGDAMLLLYILQGAPKDQIAGTLDVFTLYAIFSLVGWLFVGVPVALFLPVRWVIGWPWPLAITVGARTTCSAHNSYITWPRSHSFCTPPGDRLALCLLDLGFYRVLWRIRRAAPKAIQ